MFISTSVQIILHLSVSLGVFDRVQDCVGLLIKDVQDLHFQFVKSEMSDAMPARIA